MKSGMRRMATLLALLSAAGLCGAQQANRSRDLAATCANCHGTNGQARGDMKVLAGMPAEKMIAMVTDFKTGAQPAVLMHQIIKGYSDEQIKLIAAFYAAQPAK